MAGSSKLYLTEDGGQNFAPYNLELGDYIDGVVYEVDYVNENTLYALIGFTDNDAMYTLKLIKIK